jgi:Bacterial PH domain
MTARVRRGIAGLPEPLPAGEMLLWQGTPDWSSLVRRAFHVRKVAVYFAALFAWRAVADLADGTGLVSALSHAAWVLIPAAAACALLSALAYLSCRSTIFTITDRRVALRHGIALPMTYNLPFAAIESAGLKLHGEGTGDIPLKLTGGQRIAYLSLWPYARPWWLRAPQPMIRSIREPERVAAILAHALAQSAGLPAPHRAKGSAARHTADTPLPAGAVMAG